MKRQAYLLVTLITLTTAVALSTAKAQTITSLNLVADIPFAFNIGDKTMPAGEYTVQCVNPSSSTKVLQVRSKDGQNSVLVQTNSVIGKLENNAKLVFHRYGDQHFFAQVWLPSDSIGMQALKSRTEKARELAHGKRATETVLASARR
jgi:hypothetical protein